MENKEKQLLKLAAQKMLQINSINKEHEKRAHALRLLYRQAELGYGEIPRSYSELQEKIAVLLNQDLRVVEKALEMTGGNIKLGELGGTDPSNMNAEQSFQSIIMGD